MRKILLLFSLSIFTLLAVGQVETRYFPEGNALDQIKILEKRTKSSIKHQMPTFDVQKMLKEDAIVDSMKDAPYRFGKGFEVNYTLKDGAWISIDGGRLWSMNFESKGAISMNFIFNNLYLPEGAELYIGNASGTMLYGPLKHKDNTESEFFMTDLIEGDDVTIYLFEPSDQKGNSRLTIERVIHAYRGNIPPNVKNLTTSNDLLPDNCHNDVVCFPEWKIQSDAVALILFPVGDFTYTCSGSFLNNEGYNPYFLTAFHCVDTDNISGKLSDKEKSDVANWLFKFLFTRNTCGGNTSTTAISCNGATFRAAWQSSDFALLELNKNQIPYEGENRVSFLGWDRSGATSPNGTVIHHPAGKVMKISFDTDGLSSSNTHWIVKYNSGTTEGGSSGSPLFNSTGRVIGQLQGGNSGCTNVTDNFGRFDKSWTGGGTNDTRLSNWLGGTLTATNTQYKLEQKIIKSSPDFVVRGETFTLNIDGYQGIHAVNWISNADITVVSGQGTATARYLVSNSALGSVTAEANIGSLKLTKTIPVQYRYLAGVSSYTYGLTSPVILAGGSLNRPTWTYDSSLFDLIQEMNPQPNVWGLLLRSKYNGSTTTTISVSQDGVILSKVITLTPATKSLIVEDTPIFKNVRIYNIYGVKVYEEKNTVNFNIENTNLNRGIYFFESTDNEGNIVREKVMKNK